MPFGVHSYTCWACGKSDLCGDCIRTFCYDCEDKYRDFHPGDECPCFECGWAKNDRIIAEKLAAESGTDLAETQDK